MSGDTTSIAALVRDELAPTPGRRRYALFVGLGATTALTVALTLGVDTFFAPLIAFTAMQPHTLSTWGRMLRCIWISAVTVILTTMFGAVLLQVPWLLLPCFFLAVSAIIYAIPLSSRLVEALAILPPMARILYVGVFHPQQMGGIGFTMWAAYTVGIVTATVFSRFLSPLHPRDELAAALGAALAAARQRLRDAGARFRDVARPPEPPLLPPPSALPERLMLLERARQDGISRDDARALMALVTTAERTEGAVEVADALARQARDTTYRGMIDAEIAALLTALDTALAGYQRDASRLDRRRVGTAPAPADAAWPDVLGALAALEARQLALRRAGAFAPVSVVEAANVNAFIAQLRSLSQTLRISPTELERIAAGDVTERAADRLPGTSLRFDPYAARFALKCGLATVIALQIPLVAGIDTLFSLVVAPFLVAQTSYGATIEKAPLRLLGVVLGGALALLTMITVMVNTNDVAVWIAVFFVITTGCAYLVLGGARVSYVATQLAVTYMFVMVGAAPVTDVGLALWRVFGNFVGGVLILVTFRLVAPDYAGRQLIARLRDLLGDVLALLTPLGAAPLSLPRALALHRDIGFGVADILRLVAEARLEGHQAGIEPSAAVEAAGLTQRIAYRAVAICRSRATADLPAPPPALHDAAAAVTGAVRAHLELLRRILAARHTMARPGSRAYQHACAAAAGVAVCARPDLSGSVQTLVDQLDRARFHELADWPPAATGALFAELEHLRRIVDLLPALDAQLVRLCLPARQEAGAPRAAFAVHPAATSA